MGSRAPKGKGEDVTEKRDVTALKLREAQQAEFAARVRDAREALGRGQDATVAYLHGEADPLPSAAAILDDSGEWTKGDATIVARAFVLLVASLHEVRDLPHGDRGDEPVCAVCVATTKALLAVGVEP